MVGEHCILLNVLNFMTVINARQNERKKEKMQLQKCFEIKLIAWL